MLSPKVSILLKLSDNIYRNIATLTATRTFFKVGENLSTFSTVFDLHHMIGNYG